MSDFDGLDKAKDDGRIDSYTVKWMGTHHVVTVTKGSDSAEFQGVSLPDVTTSALRSLASKSGGSAASSSEKK